MGLGQVLDYRDSLQARGLHVTAGLYVQRQPADARWTALAQAVGITLFWPGVESGIGLTPIDRDGPSSKGQ
jgi:hypothetical protein